MKLRPLLHLSFVVLLIIVLSTSEVEARRSRSRSRFRGGSSLRSKSFRGSSGNFRKSQQAFSNRGRYNRVRKPFKSSRRDYTRKIGEGLGLLGEIAEMLTFRNRDNDRGYRK